MDHRRRLLATLLPLLLARPAGACEGPLETRKPVLGGEVQLASGFGMKMHPLLDVQKMHLGVDWRAPQGTPVIAAGAGRIVAAERDGAYGNKVVIDHGGGWQSLYAHLTDFAIGVGDCAAGRQLIGTVGSTGLSAGPHLHFEVHRDGQPIDPLRVALPHAAGEPPPQ